MLRVVEKSISRHLFWLSDERWLRIEPHLPKDELVSRQQVREMHFLQTVRPGSDFERWICLDWHVRNRRIQHDGTVRGFRSNIRCDLEGGVAIFVVTNLGSGFAQFAITNRIIQAMRGEGITDWITYFNDMAKTELSERIDWRNLFLYPVGYRTTRTARPRPQPL
jgi:hypothetical protein